ncbi:MAG: type II toxin-antitoxin system VapC family toxin [Bradymonadaceae bacterium]|nr:type II toxin-antitoxin system VapC family toxin [Lujinxingiaceae bacterium]
MAEALLFDTDVLIEFLRGRPKAAAYFEAVDEEEWYVSAITVAELYAGLRESEEPALREFLTLFEVVDVDGELARAAGAFRNQYGKTHGTGLADAVIAASARSLAARLLTFNVRHYPMVTDILVPWERG